MNWERINREIAEALEPDPGWEPHEVPRMPNLWRGKAGEPWKPFDFHEDANAMLALIDAFVTDEYAPCPREVSVGWRDDECVARVYCELGDMGWDERCAVEAATAPLAVTLAIAEALGIETEE